MTPSLAKKILFGFVSLVLAVGALFYSEQRAIIQYPNIIHSWIPTFLHVVLLSVLTVGIGGYSQNTRAFVPIFWVAVNIAVEVAQKFGIQPFFGTFDVKDLIGACAGGFVAFAIIPYLKVEPIRRLSSIVTIIFGLTILTATSPEREDVPVRNNLSKPRLFIKHEPKYLSYNDLRSSFEKTKPRSITVKGKGVTIGSLLYQSEPSQGIHVIDRTRPEAPKPLHFLVLPGNTMVLEKDGVLFADSFIDLVIINVQTSEPELTDRIENTFRWNAYQAFENDLKRNEILFSSEDIEPSKGVIIGARDKEPQQLNEDEVRHDYVRRGFAVWNNYLYVVSPEGFKVYDVTTPQSPIEVNAIGASGQILEMKAKNNTLYVKLDDDLTSEYDLTDPSAPSFIRSEIRKRDE